MRRSTDFAAVVRGGVRVRGGDALVVHFRHRLAGRSPDAPPLVGFVVGKQVGNSVVRHRVTRRLRAQLAGRLERLPSGSGTVVRALPASAAADSAALGRDVERAVQRVVDRAGTARR
jgi:ribonuclease P protein component